MRILVLSNEYAPRIIGGLGVVATKLCRHFVTQGMDVTVLTNTIAKKVRITSRNHVKIIRFPLKIKNGKNYRNIRMMNVLKKQSKLLPDVIHIHSVNFYDVAKLYKQKYGIPVVYTCHSLVKMEGLNKRRERVARSQEALMSLADQIVVPSIWQKERLSTHYPNLAHKVEVIENGTSGRQTEALAEKNRLLYVGRITRMKGTTELVTAVAKLAEVRPDVQLDIVGEGSAVFTKKLKKVAHSLGISKKIKWLGFMPPAKVLKLYGNYGAVIVPSRQESFGLVALEALTSGVPLVSTRSGGLAQFVDETVAQVITQVSPEAISGAIVNMWSNPALTQQRISAGLMRASDYDWSEAAKRYCALLNRFDRTISSYEDENLEWSLVKTWKAKRQGQVWVVKNKLGERGYFKFATKKQWYFSGPMVANELIAAQLAKKLGFPVAELEITKVKAPHGKLVEGIVSKAVNAKECITWNMASKELYLQPEKFVSKIDTLKTLVVFDAWIANIDRASGKNLILYRNSPQERYHWYLIDHGHTLFGSPRKWERAPWNSTYWEKLWLYYHVPKGLRRLQSSLEELDPMIQTIEAISESEIDEVINVVPKRYLGENERTIIKRMLTLRQKKLRWIMLRWLAYNGLKEYTGLKKRQEKNM